MVRIQNQSMVRILRCRQAVNTSFCFDETSCPEAEGGLPGITPLAGCALSAATIPGNETLEATLPQPWVHLIGSWPALRPSDWGHGQPCLHLIGSWPALRPSDWVTILLTTAM